MPVVSVYALATSNITVSGGLSLSGFTQGDGSHLVGQSLTLTGNLWAPIAISDSDALFADNDANQTLATAQIFNGATHAAGTAVEAEYRLTLRDPEGNTYAVVGFNIVEPGSPHASYGTIEGLAFVGAPGNWPPVGVPLTVIAASEGPAATAGPTATTYDSYVSPLCFVTGTRIATPTGRRPVEYLRPGDTVLTVDGTEQILLWVGESPTGGTPRADLAAFQPITIRREALGAGCPARDLRLSPQHRVMLRGWRAELYFGAQEVLTSAVSLVNGKSIVQEPLAGDWSYWHLMCDSHQMLDAEGLACESFLPGAAALAALPEAVQTEIADLFPLLGIDPQVAAARVLRPWETGVLHS